MTTVTYDIDRIIRETRARGLPNYKLAQLAGVSPTTVNKVFRGTTQTPTTIKKLAAPLGIPMAELVISTPPERAIA